MPSSDSSREARLERLAEEFVERHRRGERPALSEYTDRHPDLAAEIRDLFPAMVQIENLKPEAGDLSGAFVPTSFPRDRDIPERFGEYRILRQVGQGGMGIVYEAEQESLGRHVALKVLPRQALLKATYLERFRREAKAAAKLHHTNIVPVFGVGEHDGLPFYVMQFIQGLSVDLVLEELRRLNAGQAAGPPGSGRAAGNGHHEHVSAADLARSLMTGDFQPAEERFAGTDTTLEETPAAPNPHPAAAPPPTVSSGSIALPAPVGRADGPRAKKPTYWQSVAQIGVQAADALEYAHRQGVLHRDIKPSNLLLDTRAGVWVTDFGLAKVEDQAHLTDTGDVLGTLRYMPPEAFDGRTDARGDVYALGLTLYELLAFRPAFDERDHARLVRQVTTGEPPRLGSLNPRVPRDLETIVHKAIDRVPARRYQTAGELEADLRRFLADEPIQARRQSAAERLLRWARHHKGVAAALAAVALLLVVLAAGALAAAASFRQQGEEQRRLAGEKEQQRILAEQARTAAQDAEEREKGLRALAEKQGTELRGNLYSAEMNLAGQAAESPSGIGRMNELLASWQEGRPDLRGWEWYYLKALGQRDRLTLRGHGVEPRRHAAGLGQ
jgi:serine/threonine protein kinase